MSTVQTSTEKAKPEAAESSSAKSETQEMDLQELEARAEDITLNCMYVSMGAGLIPLPLVDFAATSLIQLEMLRRLGKLYNVPFKEGTVKKLLAALVGGGVPSLVSPALSGLVKVVPFIGPSLGALSAPILLGASTYSVGKVFIQHFASGGTFLTFDPEAVREYYYEQFKKGKAVASGFAAKQSPAKG
jgi:uncharacterized protein (DUF697 family)